MPSNKSKKFSPNKKFYAENNWSLLQVVSCNKGAKAYSLALEKYGFPKPLIFRWSQDSQAIGMILGKINERWVGIWYPFQTEFYTFHFHDQMELILDGYEVDSIEVLANERAVICTAKGKVVKKVEMPKEQMLSNWLKELRGLDSVEIEQPKVYKKEWTWNQDQYGYEAFIYMKVRFCGINTATIRTRAARQEIKALRIFCKTVRVAQFPLHS